MESNFIGVKHSSQNGFKRLQDRKNGDNFLSSNILTGKLKLKDAGFLKPTDASEDGFLGCIGAFTHFGRKDSNPLPECCDAVMSTEVECIANSLITGGLDGAFAQEIYKFCALSAPPPEASGPAAPNLPPSRP
ncbi:hypothetical protein AMTRI_Chr07g24820 [Amborella trichopoda]